MSAEWLVLNAAYLFYATSALFKEMFWLRLTLLIATFFYIAYGVIAPVTSMVVWNVPVGVLHLYALWQLFSARRGIDLDDEAEALRTLLFPELSRASFNALWHCGEERYAQNEVLILKGKPVPELFMVLEGDVEVLKGDVTFTMSRFRMIGEMSSLSGSTASATVQATNRVRLRVWNKESLATLAKTHPETNVALLKAMGQEVARKLN